MIHKQDCCGCGSCVQRCPKSCIAMREDTEGFLYPEVDERICVDCGLCEQVCPVIHQGAVREPAAVYAAKNRNEKIRRQSSSGGIFTALAEGVLKEGGVVFGALFDASWEVVHGYTETIEGLAPFRGSKYVQSRIGNSFKDAEEFLKSGRKVLFCGTSCQIAGLRKFLRKEYDSLVTVDFICHGVPSPGVWREYLKEEIMSQCDRKKIVSSHPDMERGDIQIKSISFRDKRLGWKKYSFILALSGANRRGTKKTVLYSSSKYHHSFLKGFLRNLYLRPACHRCCAKGFNSGSDVTIADFWTINKHIPQDNDAKGHSLLYRHQDSKCDLKGLDIDLKKLNVKDICAPGSIIYYSAKAHPNREAFFSWYKKSSVIKLIEQYATVSWKQRIYLLIAEMRNN